MMVNTHYSTLLPSKLAFSTRFTCFKLDRKLDQKILQPWFNKITDFSFSTSYVFQNNYCFQHQKKIKIATIILLLTKGFLTKSDDNKALHHHGFTILDQRDIHLLHSLRFLRAYSIIRFLLQNRTTLKQLKLTRIATEQQVFWLGRRQTM